MNYVEKEAGMWTKDVLETLDTNYLVDLYRQENFISGSAYKKKPTLYC